MTTLRWENLPVQQTVQTWVCELMTKQLPHPQLPINGSATIESRWHGEYLKMRDECDRYIARCKELERRLEAVRRSADGM